MPARNVAVLAETEHLETRGALAASRKGRAADLTHSVVCVRAGESSSEVRVLCDRIELDNVVDFYGMDDVTRAEAPTCKTCRCRDPRFA